MSNSDTIPLPAPLSKAGQRALVTNVVIVVVLVAITVGLCLKAQELNTTSEAGVLMQLPDSVGDYWGEREEISEAEKTILPGDTEIIRKKYTDLEGNQIFCSIVLSGGEKRSIHRPEICLPAQGWTIGAGKIEPIELKSGKTLDVMDLSLSRSREIAPGELRTLRSQFMYWFVGKDKTTPRHWDRIITTSWDRVFHKTNHRWAYVLASAAVTDNLRKNGKTAEQTTEMLEKFVREIVPTFQKSEMSDPQS